MGLTSLQLKIRLDDFSGAIYVPLDLKCSFVAVQRSSINSALPGMKNTCFSYTIKDAV